MAGWLQRAFGGRRDAHRVQSYLDVVTADPAPDDVAWLAARGDGDEDRARWELRYARRAIGLLVAEREALDDRTASLVARELRRWLQMDRNVAAGMVRIAERQFDERLRAFRHALESREGGEAAERRMGRLLLDSRQAAPGDLDRAAHLVSRYMSESGEALRSAFGLSGLPADTQPSAWRARQPR